MEEEAKNKTAISFQRAHIEFEIRLACVITAHNQGNVYKTTVAGDTSGKRLHNNARVGKPRQNWAETILGEIWDILKQSGNRFRYSACDPPNQLEVDALKHFSIQYTQT